MKMYVPEIGDKIKLIKDWKFNLYREYRNQALFKVLNLAFNIKGSGHGATNESFVEAVIPAGTVLTIDRIYIRKGISDYSSLTFMMPKARFWAKLSDVNNIEFELELLKSEEKATKTIIYIRYPQAVGSQWSDTLDKSVKIAYKIGGVEKYNPKGIIEENDICEKIETGRRTEKFGGIFSSKSQVVINWKIVFKDSQKLISNTSLQTWICKKHNLLKKDCLFRTM